MAGICEFVNDPQFKKMPGLSCLTEELLASPEALCCMILL